jgi:hypothetical protein
MLVNYYYVCIRKLYKNLKGYELEILITKKNPLKAGSLTA